MILYQYDWTAIDQNGTKITGSIRQRNVKAVELFLDKQGYIILSIKKSFIRFYFSKKMTLSHQQQIDFLEELSWLLQAGISLSDSFHTMIKSHHNHDIKKWITQLQNKIAAGTSLSAALKEYSACFSQTDCQLIAAAEQSGQLIDALKQILQYKSYLYEMKKKLIKTMSYPITVLFIAIALTGGLLIFVIPSFETIYQNFNAQLPAATALLIHISRYLSKNNALFLFCLFSITLLVFLIWKNFMHAHEKFFNLVLKLPIIKTSFNSHAIAIWSQTFSTTLSSGISIMDALKLANQTISYPVYYKEMCDITQKLEDGQTLSIALSKTTFFPMRAKQLIFIGENADALPDSIQKIAALYRAHFNHTMDCLSKIIEPVIIIGIATLIAGLIIIMYLPILKMGSIIQ